MNASLFEELLIVLSISLICTILFERLKLPTIIAYMIVGAAIGPHSLNWIDSPEYFIFIAEFGVVFLLFSLGLEFSLPKMLALRSTVFGLGGAQVAACTIVFFAAVYGWGSDFESAILIAGALALSSTAIVIRELGNQQQMHTRSTQLSIGVLLFQDLVAIVFLILVPVFAGSHENNLSRELLWALSKGILLFALLISIGKWILPRIYNEIARSHSREIFVLSTLVIALLAAWLTHSFHLSMALGGFVIGMMLGEGPFKHQIDNDIRPFKDILLGLFFVTIGMSIQLELLINYWPRLLIFTIALLIIKTLIVSGVVLLLGDRKTIALHVGLNLAQAGEFGLALIALAQMNHLILPEQASFVILLASLSMLASPFMIRYADTLINWILHQTPFDKTTQTVHTMLPHAQHVVVGGFGRVGHTIVDLLNTNNIPYIAIDHNIELIKKGRQEGHNVIYGDSTHIEILQSCHLETARLAILTFRSFASAKATIEQIRCQDIQTPIIARCYEPGNFDELISLGADWVVPEMLEASLIISAQVLALLNIEPTDIEKQIAIQRERTIGISIRNASSD